jgi:carbon starvation protein
MARNELGQRAGSVAQLAIFFTVTVAISAMSFAVVKILEGSPWATFTIAMTIPIALGMGAIMRGESHGPRLKLASVLGVALLIFAVIYGDTVAHSRLAPYLSLSFGTLVALCGGVRTAGVGAAGLAAALAPRLSVVVHEARDAVGAGRGDHGGKPRAEARGAFTQFVYGGGPIIKGKVFPFVFITVACGAISGFHSLIASGTTPKLIDKETDCRPIGYGAMLLEGMVGITSLVAAACLHPADYFAINVPEAAFQKLGMTPVEIDLMSQLVGEQLRGRTGGSVSLAAGIAQIFSQLPGAQGTARLLLSLHRHVRGRVHPDHRRCWHSRGALFDARHAGSRRSALLSA